MAPTDQRYLDMCDEQIMLEYEMSLAAEGKQLYECHKCGFKTYRGSCPRCSIEISADPKMDLLIEKLEAGEIIDIATALSNEEWEPVEI